MRVRDLIEILDRFRKGDLGDCNVRIVFPNDPNKFYSIKEMTFAPNKLIGQAKKFRMIIYVEDRE